MTPCQAWVLVGADIALAVITIFAVLVALYKDVYWERKKRPRLSLEVETGPPLCTRRRVVTFTQNAATTMADVTEFYRLRFAVKNHGPDSARNVEVYIMEVRAKDNKMMETFTPSNLIWSDLESSPGIEKVVYPTINRGTKKYCLLGDIVNPAGRKMLSYHKDYIDRYPPDALFDIISEENVAILDLATLVKEALPALPPSTFLLNVMVTAENAQPVLTNVELTFSGKWEEMPTKGVQIKISGVPGKKPPHL